MRSPACPGAQSRRPQPVNLQNLPAGYLPRASELGVPGRYREWGRYLLQLHVANGDTEFVHALQVYDLRHTGHTLSTQSGATLKDTMVRAGQSSTRAALIYQHSPLERQRKSRDKVGRSSSTRPRLPSCRVCGVQGSGLPKRP